MNNKVRLKKYVLTIFLFEAVYINQYMYQLSNVERQTYIFTQVLSVYKNI